MSDALKGVRKGLKKVLALRDNLGLVIVPVDLVTRTWKGTNIGDGTKRDEVRRMFPSPAITDLSHSVRLMEGGSVRQGDLILKAIAKDTFTKSELLHEFEASNVEGFFLIGETLYKAVNIKEKHFTWEVLVRPQTGSSYGKH